jgi:hypothetical protein
MRRRWTLIAVLAALVVLVGLLIYMNVRPKPAAAAPESTLLELSNMTTDSVVKIVLTYGTGGLTMEKKDNVWSVGSPVALDEMKTNDIVATFTNLYAHSLVDENPTDLAQYGLATPKAKAVVTTTDGTKTTFILGEKTPSGDSYYVQVQGDPKVYTVYQSVGDHWTWKVANLRGNKLSPEINSDEITYFKMRGRDGVVIEVQEKTQAEQSTTSLGMGLFIVTKPYVYPIGANPEPTDTLLRSPVSIEITDFVDDNPRSLAPYGLDRPWGEFTIRDKANTLSLQFGSDKDDQSMYFKVAGKPGVYTVAKSLLAFMDTKPFEIIDRFLYLPNILDVDRIDITGGGKTHACVLTRTVKKAETEGVEDETITAYTVDGKAIEESVFKDFYQILIGVQAEGEASRAGSSTPTASIRYTRNTGDPKVVTVNFMPYNQDFFAVLVSGKGGFAVSKAQWNRVLDALDKMIKGEPLPS